LQGILTTAKLVYLKKKLGDNSTVLWILVSFISSIPWRYVLYKAYCVKP